MKSIKSPSSYDLRGAILLLVTELLEPAGDRRIRRLLHHLRELQEQLVGFHAPGVLFEGVAPLRTAILAN